MKKKIIFLIFILIIMTLRFAIQTTKEASSRPLNELLYFPNGKSIDKISLDYKSTVSNFLWLQTIQYYGQHMLSDKELILLYKLFDVITTLDPNFRQCYTFGATIVTYDQKNPQLGKQLLLKGMSNMSDDWSVPFVAGFLDYVYLRNYESAYHWFIFASTKRDAPEYCRSFAASAKKKEGDYLTAIKIWSEIYLQSKNKFEIQKAELNILTIIMQEFQKQYSEDKNAFLEYAREESSKMDFLPFPIKMRLENDSVKVERK